MRFTLDDLADIERQMECAKGEGLDRLTALRSRMIAASTPAEVVTAQPWTPISRHEIAGRGTIFTGPYPFGCSTANAIGRRLLVDGETFEVGGVEWNLGHQPRTGDAVGLLVRPLHGSVDDSEPKR